MCLSSTMQWLKSTSSGGCLGFAIGSGRHCSIYILQRCTVFTATHRARGRLWRAGLNSGQHKHRIFLVNKPRAWNQQPCEKKTRKLSSAHVQFYLMKLWDKLKMHFFFLLKCPSSIFKWGKKMQYCEQYCF